MDSKGARATKGPQIRLRASRERDAAGRAQPRSPSLPTECIAPQPPKILTLEPAGGLPGSRCREAAGRKSDGEV